MSATLDAGDLIQHSFPLMSCAMGFVISIFVEIIFVKKYAHTLGIEANAKWIRTVLISTLLSVAIVFASFPAAQFLSPFIREEFHPLFFVPPLITPTLLRVLTYDFASP